MGDILRFAAHAANAEEADRDELIWDAMLHCLGVIGIAASGMTEAFRARHAGIAWDDVIAMQDFVGKPDRLLDRNTVQTAITKTMPMVSDASCREGRR